MKTEFKDVAHLYLGCEVLCDTGKRGRFSGLDLCQNDNSITMLTVRYSDDIDDWDVLNDNEEISRIKPILRPLSDMTEEEFKEQTIKCLDIRYMNHTSGYYSPEEFSYLLSKHFDLFGLLESNQAIDATTLKTTA